MKHLADKLKEVGTHSTVIVVPSNTEKEYVRQYFNNNHFSGGDNFLDIPLLTYSTLKELKGLHPEYILIVESDHKPLPLKEAFEILTELIYEGEEILFL